MKIPSVKKRRGFFLASFPTLLHVEKEAYTDSQYVMVQ